MSIKIGFISNGKFFIHGNQLQEIQDFIKECVSNKDDDTIYYEFYENQEEDRRLEIGESDTKNEIRYFVNTYRKTRKTFSRK